MSTIVSIKKVANGSLQAEMLDRVEKTGAINVLAKLNKGDQRFVSGSERRAWFPVTLQSLAELGLAKSVLDQIEAGEQGSKFPVKIENPTIDGFKLRVQINESIFADVYQRQNTASAAKQLEITPEVAANARLKSSHNLADFVGKVGYFMDDEGHYIFSRATVTIEPQLNHTFIDGTLVPETMLAEYGANLADATTVQVEEEATA